MENAMTMHLSSFTYTVPLVVLVRLHVKQRLVTCEDAVAPTRTKKKPGLEPAAPELSRIYCESGAMATLSCKCRIFLGINI